ncbi:MAG: hypothetical protein PVG14_16915 [Anaerolineales bacterium]|jgi:hypothetical protein
MNGQDEKQDEKEMQKREEKSPEEKSWEEKYRRDPVGTLIWAVIFIWAGLVLLANNLGLIDRLVSPLAERTGYDFLEGFEVWSIILIGAGVLFLIEILVRLLIPEYRRPVVGTLIFAVILIGIGLGDLWSWNLVWPLILIVLGGSIILRGLIRK